MSTKLVENHLAFSKIPRISLNVRNLSISASKSGKQLIDSFSIDLHSGSVMAVMGGSGSGKTTLLNVLASKISGGLTVEGDIKYVLEENNGMMDDDDSSIEEHVKMAYLPQQDILPARLTCRETLMCAADLKLNKSKQEKINIVNQLIDELGLKDCADTLVGDSKHKGLSGGEKRRLSIGTQMVSNPSIMFLDEPTTGLDSYSAYLVIKTIKKLAKDDGRIFIMSIHQPRSDILFLLDHVTLLSRGQVAYSDVMKNTIPYFESLGYAVPPLVNPADYFVDLSSVDTRSDSAQEVTQARLDSLVNHWKNYETNFLEYRDISGLEAIEVQSMNTMLPFLKQVSVLTKRNFMLNSRDYVTLASTFFEPLIIGSVVGWIYFKPDKTSLSGLRTTSSCLYSVVILQCYLYLLFDTYRLCEQDIQLFDRERAEGSVSALAFATARKLSLFLTDDVIMVFLFTVTTYFMFGLEANARKFFIQFAVVFFTQLSCSGLSMISVGISRDYSKASLVGNLTFTVLSMGCGFFVNAKYMPVYVRWTKYIAFTWYGFGTLLSSTFTDSYCNGATDLSECLGNQIVSNFGFPKHWIKVPLVILFCWSIGYWAVALIVLHIHKVDITLQSEVKSKTAKSKKSKNEQKNPFTAEILNQSDKDMESSTSSPYEINVDLQNINLKVNYLHLSNSLFGDGILIREQKQILQCVSASFKPGMINAIMGPSGSGKSTLLNIISGRVKSSIFAKFDKSGSIMFNGNEVSEHMFKNVCSYVSQDDDHLLSKLTVKETFKFAADLRLHNMTYEQRSTKTDELIRALGLKHCENNIIGDEFVKGISGGEKRRVTMGIQLQNDPPIILLDEPTSGLDSFTSSTILEILKKLAVNYGKTIILTIHQPRAELFKQFGNVLLLAKSGRTAFNGSPNEMIQYFEDLGFECPAFTNVADFFLDLISINTQNIENEMKSRERVEMILENWKIQSNSSLLSSTFDEKEPISQETFILEYGDCIRQPCNSGLAYYVNVRRQLVTTRRNIDSLLARIAQVPGLGIIFALYFAPLKHNYASVANRLGLVQESTALYFCGMLVNLACYPRERDYFYKEHEDGVYGVGPFILAYMTLELPLSAVGAIIYAVFTVMACGLPRTPGNFFANVYCSFLITACGEALGIMTNTFFERPGFVVNCMSMLLSIGSQMSGLMSLTMPRVLRGINYINPLKYTSMVIINLAFPEDLKFTCEDGGQNPDGTCEFSTGRDVLDIYGLHTNINKYLGIAVCVAFIYRGVAFIVLKAKLEWLKW
ncbi:hypothetical protein KAFR_0C01200 [Kazachstania africana CBS 2517]|uniref:ABC transporter domain-containing protein n=1 Tax=Kazachstania africana (strain ATCC 22294 / BCRC 22015 / CBS 2517 / CECT 1963 / NBRC 1671 / NRRL Y-8276) TaxID=1071382 RepID=H2ARW5_KAZAF|nr:hypothetical protein KAFR_0C01200 [Kazachstania africana CBS 2517]CCF57115.1 hypothetical protein KAFR_0C01200 [Kazachstania africana CBS 2517]